MWTAGNLCALAVAEGWSSKTEVGLIVGFIGFVVFAIGAMGEEAYLYGPGGLLMIIGFFIVV